MEITDQLRAFVATARTGSFTTAADQMGISNRLTSKYVAELEQRLGVRLLQRTTRKVGLTPAGEEMLARAPALLDELDDLLRETAQGAQGFTGLIRIAAPVTFGEMYLAPVLARFAAQHPELHCDLRLSDQFVDLASDGIDLGFRIGASSMQSLKTQKIGEVRLMAAASPQYVAQHGRVQTLEALAQQRVILDSNRRAPRKWVFYRDGTEHLCEVSGAFQVNSARAAVHLAVDGHGITYAPQFALQEALDTGALVPVLEGYEGVTMPISVVHLAGTKLPRKLRALIEFVAADLKAAQRGQGDQRT